MEMALKQREKYSSNMVLVSKQNKYKKAFVEFDLEWIKIECENNAFINPG